MSDTPRTDAFYFPNGKQASTWRPLTSVQGYEYSCQLERENEALRKLLVEARRELLLRVSYDGCPLISKIDAAIKEQSHG